MDLYLCRVSGPRGTVSIYVEDHLPTILGNLRGQLSMHSDRSIEYYRIHWTDNGPQLTKASEHAIAEAIQMDPVLTRVYKEAVERAANKRRRIYEGRSEEGGEQRPDLPEPG